MCFFCAIVTSLLRPVTNTQPGLVLGGKVKLPRISKSVEEAREMLEAFERFAAEKVREETMKEIKQALKFARLRLEIDG